MRDAVFEETHLKQCDSFVRYLKRTVLSVRTDTHIYFMSLNSTVVYGNLLYEINGSDDCDRFC